MPLYNWLFNPAPAVGPPVSASSTAVGAAAAVAAAGSGCDSKVDAEAMAALCPAGATVRTPLGEALVVRWIRRTDGDAAEGRESVLVQVEFANWRLCTGAAVTGYLNPGSIQCLPRQSHPAAAPAQTAQGQL